MFYLNFSKDKYKVPYIYDTPKEKITTIYMRNLKPPSQKNTHLTPKVRGLNSNRPKTRQQKRKMKSNRGRRKGKSNGLMVMEHVVSERKIIRIFLVR